LAGRDKRRIEPEFEGDQPGRRDQGMYVTEDDRPARPARSQKQVRKSSKARQPKQRTRRRSGIGRLFYWMFVLSIWAGIGVAGVVGYYGAKMPSATTWAIPERAPNVKIVANNGSLLANRGINGGEALSLNDMSPYIPQAVVAIEDKRFYSHFGFDPIGFSRAMVRNVMAGKMVQGGSTLTQQLAKNLFLKPDRTLERKVQEVLLALWLEQKYSKDQILEMYLNRVYYGSGAYGVEAAARRYFSKSARDVSLTEAATIAAVLKAPSYYSPAKDADAANKRAKLVLNAMREQGMIGDKELGSAESKPVTKAAAYWNGSEQFVADRVMSELADILKGVKSDVIVDTTIDTSLQQAAETAITARIAKSGKKLNVHQGALVSIDTTGAVRAYVGGVDYASSQYDRAGTAQRQPGSTFKPFVYLAALEMGRTPDSIRNDAPIKIGKWKPENYEGKYYGPVSLAVALSKSLNSVAAQLVMETGPDTVIEVAHRLGIRSKLESNLAISLGTSDVNLLELTGAYSAFSNGGNHVNTHIIKRVTSIDGTVLYEVKQDNAPPAIQPEVVGMMNAMLKRTLAEGTAQKAQFDWPAGGKTGTSQSFRDAWFIGFTAHLTTGVWFGNDDNTPMNKVTGGSLPAVAWKEYMTKAHEGLAKAELPGTWQSGSVPDTSNLAPVENEVPIVQEASPADPIGQVIEQDGVVQELAEIPLPKPSPERTGSTKRPVPKVNVGEKIKRKNTSEPKTILDVILGN
jgi:penicillin-binding protein 1A